MSDLVEIFRSQGNTTDKLTAHHYPYIYEEIFRPLENNAIRLLEIGISQGGSIRAWNEYFKAKGTIIYGLDIVAQFVMATEDLDPHRVRCSELDVANKTELATWLIDKEFDVVIDDGSHKLYDILNAFDLIWPKIVPGGYYFIEDAAQADLPERLFNLMIDVGFNQNDVISLTVWPNLIGIEKKETNDPRCPTIGTL